MKSKKTAFNQQYLPILLIICGGPIGKGNNKTIVQPEAASSINKKQTKSNLEEEKKPSYSGKTK
ncbi:MULTISPECIES: hypothetical protein [Sphingobacterium]|uniref:Uncharacterized protein n=1 Tax=Sphingobacterium athyrii TaxID=2152717 RepID=A0A363NXW8_9SPHI|nr:MULTISPECIES: hypothetical protein [Sphingobacterium]PUV25511.1 hypothetical protein DCO56_00505 [Sphingobacterium athyrii]QIH33730.1 hypothetical protein G6053_12915 [Sphingobacterium sp. DR205]